MIGSTVAAGGSGMVWGAPAAEAAFPGINGVLACQTNRDGPGNEKTFGGSGADLIFGQGGADIDGGVGRDQCVDATMVGSC